MSEFENERIAGLPGPLPAGERILWRGGPDWRVLAWRVYHVREALAWFAGVAAVRAGLGVADGATLADALGRQAWTAPVCALACVILGGLAWMAARTTIYTITDRRIVMRIGVALPMTVNVPFAQIADAHVRRGRGDVGDVGVSCADGTRLAWAVMWPHVRPWRLRRPQPTLRCIPDVSRAADLLSRALTQSLGAALALRTPVAEPAAAAVPARGGAGLDSAAGLGAAAGLGSAA